LEKARGHKYIKRTGTPGHYRYEYETPSGEKVTVPSRAAEKAPMKEETFSAAKAAPTHVSRQLQKYPDGTMIQVKRAPKAEAKWFTRKGMFWHEEGTESRDETSDIVKMIQAQEGMKANIRVPREPAKEKPPKVVSDPVKQKEAAREYLENRRNQLMEGIAKIQRRARPDADDEKSLKAMAESLKKTQAQLEALDVEKKTETEDSKTKAEWEKRAGIPYPKTLDDLTRAAYKASDDSVALDKKNKKLESEGKAVDTAAILALTDRVNALRSAIDAQGEAAWKNYEAGEYGGERPVGIRNPTGPQFYKKPTKTEKSISALDTLAKALPSEETDISPEKARKILHDGEVHGRPLTDQQRKFFGAIASKGKKKTEKSMSAIDALNKHINEDETLEKGMFGYGVNGNLEWAGRMSGTPFEVDALQCVKDLNTAEYDRKMVFKKYDKPWDEKRRMDPVERAKLEKKTNEMYEKCRKKENDIRMKMDEIEKKYLDWRIEQAKEAKKSEGVDGDLEKAGPYIGPKGGKWADAAHTIPWKTPWKTPPKSIPQKESEKEKLLSEHQEKIIAKKAEVLALLKTYEDLQEEGNRKGYNKISLLHGLSPEAEAHRNKQKAAWKAMDESHSELGVLENKIPSLVKKSMNGLGALEEHLMKSDIPTGQPTDISGGPENGGPLDGKGKNAGTSNAPQPDPDQTPEGNPKDVPTPKGEDWSLEEQARKVFGGLGGTMKSMGSLEHDQAIAERNLKKGEPDVHPLQTSAIHGGGVAVSKSGTHELDPRNAIISQEVLCKSCNHTHPAMLTACPNCGNGTIGNEVLHKSNPGVILDDPKGRPLLKPPPTPKDILIKE
jgi:hypothetical protein